ncbi:ammonium transporter [Acaryochloris marina]|uniref:Ammonium transporter n=1 Tax=Acaryochloris marina (strain MBIC 11017) TaxID=329726 RepID=A8ZQD5_ACAM1|nr:ammonium transporter [Acaryochloris marina]ABW33221.1 ammonium transporter [Acaryochloris marina MBIC11017]
MIDLLWMLLCTGLVFLMQAGFMCVESGLTRSKNSINVAVKNMADFGLSVALFWCFGYALMFGASQGGWLGGSRYFPSSESSPKLIVFFLYQAMFCGTATTIISGAVAERLQFVAYLIIASLVSSLIYPLFGHWAWNSLVENNTGGWLENLGFIDFAGSTVVHSVGAWVSLATLIIVGSRQGRFSDQGATQIQGSNLPFSVLGALLLWFGWIGFNGGSTLALNEQVPGIILNTMIAGIAGMVTAALLSWLQHRLLAVESLINGTLAGLVAITACCHVVATPLAFVVGSTGAAVALWVSYGLHRLRIDDAVDAVAVHGGAGAWGTLCVALFGQLSETGMNRASQLLVQLLGIGVCFAWAFGLSWLLLSAVNRFVPLRVSAEDERLGLNISEHHAKTDTYELFQVMDQQAKTSDLSLRVPVEPFTEVGHIATRYNQVIDSLARNHQESAETLAQIYMITAASAAVVENQLFDPHALDLDEICDRDDELGTLAQVLQQLVTAVHQRDQELATLKTQFSPENGQTSDLRIGSKESIGGAIVEILMVRFGAVSPQIIEEVAAISDANQLKILLKWAMATDSIVVFQAGIRRQLDTVSDKATLNKSQEILE